MLYADSCRLVYHLTIISISYGFIRLMEAKNVLSSNFNCVTLFMETAYVFVCVLYYQLLIKLYNQHVIADDAPPYVSNLAFN